MQQSATFWVIKSQKWCRSVHVILMTHLSDISETPFWHILDPLSNMSETPFQKHFFFILFLTIFLDFLPQILVLYLQLNQRPHSDISETPFRDYRSGYPFPTGADTPFQQERIPLSEISETPFRYIREPFQKNIFPYFFLHNFLCLFASNSVKLVQLYLMNLNLILT